MLSSNSWDPDAKQQWADAYPPYEKANKLSVDQAKALVDKSGAAGAKLKLIVLGGDATQSQMAQVIQEAASSIGVTVEIVALQPTQYSDAGVNAAARKNYDLMFAVGFNGLPDPVEPVPFFVQKGSVYNYTDYSNPQVDALINKARQTFDAQERTKLMVQAQTIYERERVATSLLNKNEILFLSNKLTGATVSFPYLFEPSLARIGAAG